MRFTQSNASNRPQAAEARLIPVLARALDLGRGPPGLVSWVRSRVPASASQGWNGGVALRDPLLKRLAGELSQMLPQAALETFVGRGLQPTVRVPAPDATPPRQPADPARTHSPSLGTDARLDQPKMNDTAELYYRIFEFAPDAILVVDPDGRIIRANAQAETLFGRLREELTGQPVEILIPGRFAEQHVRLRTSYIAAANTRRTGVGQNLTGLRKDGSEFPVDIVLAPLGTEKGMPVLAVVRDATERKQAEEHARLAGETALKELDHRVKNNLQVISSLLFLQSTQTSDPNTVAALLESRGRIKSIALIHEKLSRSQNTTAIDFEDYVRDLVADMFHSYGTDTSRVRFSTRMDGVRLSMDTAIPCGLIINELVSNALKYAFPGNRRGEVIVEVVATGAGRFTLTVRDTGIGLPNEFDLERCTSLGLRLVSDLARQLGGTVSVEPGSGAAFKIEFREFQHPERS